MESSISPFGYGPEHPGRYGMRLHHVQLAIPEGSEPRCREFWVETLGFLEIPKPPVLAQRGGLWVRCDALEVHLGVEDPFYPSKKAHPGIVVEDLEELAAVLEAAAHRVEWDDHFPAHRRFYCTDPFGNRLEFLSPDRPAAR